MTQQPPIAEGLQQVMGASATHEEWRAPLGYRGWYEVSSLGRIRRGERILQGALDRYGYRTVNLSVNGVKSREKVHRLVCQLFNGPPPTRQHEVAHLDGDKANNAATNLVWATRSENGRHSVALGVQKGTANLMSGQPLGEANANAKLTAEQVREMRRKALGGQSERSLAREFGISPSQAHKIIAKELWAHVE